MQLAQRFTRFGLPTVLAALVVAAAGTAVAATTCFDFSSMPVGASFSVGDSVVTPTATIDMRPFQWSNGVWTNAGYAEVDASNNAQGTPNKELEVNNIVVRVIPNTPAYAANYLYASFGGNINFAVNNDFRNINNPPSVLDGAFVGGSDITVISTSVLGGEFGEVIITPAGAASINRFAIGGQEFFIDDVCFDY
jgi:hypothetical protein